MCASPMAPYTTSHISIRGPHHPAIPQISENAKLTDIKMENLIYIGGDLNVRP